MTSQKGKLTEGPIFRTLIDLTIPMIFGMLGVTIFNLVDTYFVGQLGTDELAAMSFTFPVIMAVASLSLGLGVGASAVISRAIGEGNQEKVQRLTTDSLILAILVVAVFVTVGIFTIDPLFRFLGATPEILPLIREYMVIWYFGAVALVVPMIGNSAIRATGDTRTPSTVMLIAGAVNIILDPLLIFGWGPFPRLELAGAAYATVASRAVTLVVSLWILYKREEMISLVLPPFRTMLDSWRQVLYIGLPTAITNMMLPVSTGIVTRLIASFGPASVAAFGVATRIEGFGLMVVMALGSVVSPFVGQNWGAKKYDRAQLSITYSQRLMLGWGLILVVIFGLLGRPLASLFNDDPTVIATVQAYFWIIPISYGLFGVLRLGTTVLSVLSKPFQSALLTLAQTFALYIPLAYVGADLFGLNGIFGAAALSYVISGIITYFWLRKSLADSMEYDYLHRIVTQDNRPNSIGYWINHLNRHARDYFNHSLVQFQLESSTLAFLMTLYREDGLNYRTLSDRLKVNESIANRVVGKLLDLGYVTRTTDPQLEDGYGFFVTQKAQDIAPDIRKVLNAWTETLSQGFTEEEKAMAVKLMQRMHANAVAGMGS